MRKSICSLQSVIKPLLPVINLHLENAIILGQWVSWLYAYDKSRWAISFPNSYLVIDVDLGSINFDLFSMHLSFRFSVLRGLEWDLNANVCNNWIVYLVCWLWRGFSLSCTRLSSGTVYRYCGSMKTWVFILIPTYHTLLNFSHAKIVSDGDLLFKSKSIEIPSKRRDSE